jgi:hypothetical protein
VIRAVNYRGSISVMLHALDTDGGSVQARGVRESASCNKRSTHLLSKTRCTIQLVIRAVKREGGRGTCTGGWWNTLSDLARTREPEQASWILILFDLDLGLT